jgi:hypothetical protein
VFKALIILSLILSWQNASAYIDTTTKDFQKPQVLKPHPYKYAESDLDQYIDIAADKLGGNLLGTVITGPVGLVLKVSDRIIDHQENKNAEISK